MIGLQGPSQIINNDETFTFFREGEVQYIDGKPVKKGIHEFQINGSIQPIGGKELLLVPEGDRDKEQYWIWTNDEIRVNDRLLRCGANFQVQTVQSWGSFFESRIMRIDIGPHAPATERFVL